MDMSRLDDLQTKVRERGRRRLKKGELSKASSSLDATVLADQKERNQLPDRVEVSFGRG